MKRIVRKTHKLKDFFDNGIWDLNLEELSKAKARFIKYIRILLITIKSYIRQKTGPQAAALSYFTMMAAVPLIAIVFVITGGLGLGDKLQELLYMHFSDNPQAIDTVLNFAQNTLASVRGGWLGFTSAVAFLWFIIRLFANIEGSFNDVWHVSKGRSAIKRASYYLAILTLTPFIVFVLFSSSLLYSNLLDMIGLNISDWGFLSKMLTWITYSILAIITFSAMYKFIPNYDVKYGNALRAAVFAGIAFTLMQYLYLETQLVVSNWNGVYGTFAAVPLLMIWLNISWSIILIGAEVSYAFQHVENYKLDNKN